MNVFCLIILQIGQLTSALNKVIDEYKILNEAKYVNVSVSIRELKSSKEVFSHNSNLSMPPASTFKLLSTASALETFGPDYRFQSDGFLTGKVMDEVLLGNLIINGNSNPAFGAKRFNKNSISDIVNALKNQNIKRIEGKIKVQRTKSFNMPLDWQIGDVGNYYGAFPSEFNFNENMFSVFFDSGSKLGDSVIISRVIPEFSKWKIKNLVTTAEPGSGDQVNFLSLPFSKEIIAAGTIPVNSKSFEIKGAIPEPDMVFEELLKKSLIENGIEIAGQDYVDETFIPFFTESSPAISELIKECNYKSVNFLADGFSNILLQKNALKNLSEVYNLTLGVRDSVDYSLFRINDGSGLSPSNTISTSAMTRFLSAYSGSRYFDVFFESLPVVGESGTVRSFDPNKKTKGRINAKSGSIGGVKNLSGYFKNEKNELYSFAIYLSGLNDTAGLFSRNFYEKILTTMIDVGQF
ncbi:MAG: D-alanyl-D-alanine carboxypeptidase/D-alanyl-D-alanine-endopeptidase [Cytophagaceae bacterium]|nr:D-alanyl-D-alanine carboxypeptidase/D-alanyl-D-alanine-endopeptidase [Cytophagaceae bacterium]